MSETALARSGVSECLPFFGKLVSMIQAAVIEGSASSSGASGDTRRVQHFAKTPPRGAAGIYVAMS